MLKALQLAGFKSFADKTRFQYPPGITVVVGPNGSGKSNVVDAIKWVLGTQSAKSLRGQEMTDVIFTGCGSRGPLHTAEVTLTLDNSTRWLGIEAPEVHFTRRVYRSGEGEYLLNKQPCRLRDFRDLLAGTGLATQAYCIIEQGRVDAVLQSSPRDRRLIFEEAAGISRFRSKQAEASRRLERVEQNLLRLSDIVDEVESRLRSVRSQAGKAQRYRECVARLQELRTHIGLADWQSLSDKIMAREAEAKQLREQGTEVEQKSKAAEAELIALEQTIEAEGSRLREMETAALFNREQIAVAELTIKNHQAKSQELEQTLGKSRRQLLAMTSRSGNLDHHTRNREEDLRRAEEEFAAADELLKAGHRTLEETAKARDQSRQQLEQSRAAQTQAIRKSSEGTSALAIVESQLKSLAATSKQVHTKLDASAEQANRLASELAQADESEREWSAQHEATKEKARQLQQDLATRRQELAQAETKHQKFESQSERVRERATVLEELEQRLEGLASGVKFVLEESRRTPNGPFADVCGLVADLFHVDVDTAPLVDVALGGKAEHVVVASGKGLFDWLQHGMGEVPGRVSFLRLDGPSAANPLERIDLRSEAGVIGRADQFVETDPPFASLARRLLGRTWLVDSLDTAARLAQGAGFGLNFVTSDGYLYDAEGTLVVGPRLASAGRLSRRSELRASHDQLAELEKQRNIQRIARDGLRHTVRQAEAAAAAVELELAELAGNLTERRHKSAALRERLEHANQVREHAHEESISLAKQVESLEKSLGEKQAELAKIREEVDRLAQEMEQASIALARAERQWSDVHADVTTKQVAAAKLEQRVDILRGQMEQAARDQQERQRAIEEKEQQIRTADEQLAQCGAEILVLNQRLADLLLEKENAAKEFEAHAADIDEMRRNRAILNEGLRGRQQELQKLQAQLHRLELEIGRLTHERDILCQRIAEDYGIDLRAAASESQVASLENRGEIEREIAELRQKLQNIGAVNLDALDELDDLEARYNSLSQQYEDLVQAKATLERIIQRISVDSRQLFLTTLDVIRGHFRELFRRLFGGGEADLIVLEEGEDVLDCGVEIVARPPGKETRSISLLSGGERTLTCVALLLAVFKSKPAPFCVLDEVDAALDESNIDRFMSVLREFLSSTQFLVVTHSKKTMFGADTLYGVTMQETGVSKLVSVRIEDVSEDGHIRMRNRGAASSDDEQPGLSRQAA